MIQKEIKKMFLADPYKKDFAEYKKYVDEKHSSTLINHKEDIIKGTYRKIYYFNYLINKINKNKCITNKFLIESKADLIMAMELYNMNYRKPTKIMLRSSIEQFFRWLLDQKKNEYPKGLGVRKILDLIKDKYKNSDFYTFISSLLGEYDRLCDYAHVDSEQLFTNKLVLSNFNNFDNKEILSLNREIQRITESFIVLVINIEITYFKMLTRHDRHLVLNSLSKGFRQNIDP